MFLKCLIQAESLRCIFSDTVLGHSSQSFYTLTCMKYTNALINQIMDVLKWHYHSIFCLQLCNSAIKKFIHYSICWAGFQVLSNQRGRECINSLICTVLFQFNLSALHFP